MSNHLDDDDTCGSSGGNSNIIPITCWIVEDVCILLSIVFALTSSSLTLCMLFLQVLCQLCDRPCLCPRPSPQCPKGVPLVLDGCQCCQVCARQRGESCSNMLPCDSQRGLQCDYSASFPGDPGECVSECFL